ncbi:MAG: DUF6497 family protein [Marinibacterium sp.]
MIWRLAALPALLAGLAAADPVPVAVPSGLKVSLSEILLDETPGALWARFRFLAPDIVPGSEALGDIEYLCASVALPYLDHHDIEAERIAVSLSDRVVEFGAKDPEATQFFELFRPGDGTCIWEGF